MKGKMTETKHTGKSSNQEKNSDDSVEYNRRLEIKKYLHVDECAICKTDIMKLCRECQENWSKTSIEECIVAVGKCNHAFHFHCLARWFLKHNVCPQCNKKWEYQEYRLEYGN